MAAKKLFHVTATLEVEMVVLAENQKQAEEVGNKKWAEEIRNAGLEPELMYVEEVKHRYQLDYLHEDDLAWLSPYGPEDAVYEKGADSPQLSINAYLDQLGIK